MTAPNFHAAFQRAVAVLTDAGVKNFLLVAYDPGTGDNTGVSALNVTTPTDATSLFHDAAQAMFPVFAGLNGLPSSVAAEAMRELVCLAENTHMAKSAPAARRPLDPSGEN